MQLKIKTLKFTTKAIFSLFFAIFFNTQAFNAQDTLQIDDTDNITVEPKQIVLKDTLKKTTRFRVDGIAGVVGDYIVLDSDIEKTMIEMQQQNFSVADITSCELFALILCRK